MTFPLVTVAPGPHGKEAKRPRRTIGAHLRCDGGAGRALPALRAGLVNGEALRFCSNDEAHP